MFRIAHSVLWTVLGLVQLYFHYSCAVCPVLNITGAKIVAGSKSSYVNGDLLTFACDTGYAQTAGGTNANCTSGSWRWSAPKNSAIVCSRTCAVPQVSNAVTSPNEATFTAGAEVTLSCLTGYLHISGSATATCGSDGTWTWASQGSMQCLRECPSLQLSTGSVLTSGSAPYTEGDTVTLSCSTNYVTGGGNTEGLCNSFGEWQWDAEDGPLQCSATCPSPTAENYTTMLSTAKSEYVEDDVVEFGCLSGYVYSSGGFTVSCNASHQWQWTGGSAPLGCIIAPKYKGQTAATFKGATCSHYVSRPTPTSSTCLLSCLYDEYCEGYAFKNGTCFTDRPLIEPQTTSINCTQRSG